MPGHYAGSVADASDEELRTCKDKDLAAIRAILEQDGEQPDKDGFAPQAWKDSLPRGKLNNLNAAERSERRIRAIDAELERRKQERAEQQQRDQERAKAQLEKLLEEAPAKAKELADAAREAQSSVDRLRQLVSDIETVGRLKSLQDVHAALQHGSEEAAEALGKTAPDIPDLPPDVVTSEDVEAVNNKILKGRHDGWSQAYMPGDYAKVRQIARRL